MFLKAKIRGYVALVNTFAQLEDPEENERAASVPLFPQNAKDEKFWAVVGYI